MLEYLIKRVGKDFLEHKATEVQDAPMTPLTRGEKSSKP